MRVCSRKQLCWELRKDFEGGTEKLKGGELKGRTKGPLAIGHGSLSWCNVGTTSTSAKAFR